MTQTLSAHIANALSLERAGAIDGAVSAYEAALVEAPDLAEAHFNRANLLARAGRHHDALAGFDHALALRPRWAAAHLNRGALLAALGQMNGAIAAYRMAVHLEPRNDFAWSNLGNALSSLSRHQEAIDALRTARRLAPKNAIAAFNLGNALTASGRTAEAAQAFFDAVTLDAGMAAAAVNLSGRLRELGAPEAALQAAQMAVNAAPGLPQAHTALGNAFYDFGAFAEAEACHRRALALNQGCERTLANLALALSAQGRFAEALSAYEAAIARAPDYPQARFGRATAFLATGDFARGWPAFAARHAMPEVRPRAFKEPVWQGEAATGQKILVHAEQGFGDTLQFVRFVPRISAFCGARVILEVQRPLVRLLQKLPGVAEVLAAGDELPRFDLHCPMLDLPGIFARNLESLAPAAPYLEADPALVASRPLPSSEGALRVGLVWAGQSRPGLPHAFAMDRRRSLTLGAFGPLAPICRSGAIRLFSLQHGEPAGQLQTPPDGLVIEDLLAGVSDFAETAASIAQLDLVIAVDTSTAHLAAAMGKPVWLLSRFDACWRWLHGRSDSPWYPTLTLFRQERPNDWGGPVAAIAARLGAKDIKKKGLLF